MAAKSLRRTAAIYMGGEDDIRGFDILTISPIAFLPTSTSITVSEHRWDAACSEGDETPMGQLGLVRGHSRQFPAYQLILPGGDTAVVFNYEYRIPIVGPVTLAPFLDAGIDKLYFPANWV